MSTDVSSSSQDVSEVQNRLMEMLESVRLEKPAEPVEQKQPESNALGDGCQNCGSTEPWGGSSWCPVCGYYPKLGRAVFDPESEEEPEPQTLWEMIPPWLIWMSGGMLALLVESLVLRLTIPDVNIRGPLAILQIIVGLLVYSVCHARAYFIASQRSEKVGPASFFFDPGTLWKYVFEDLPNSRAVVVAGTNGVVAALLAVSLIGLDWNGIFKPEEQANKPKFNPMKTLMQGAVMMADVKAQASGGGGMSAGDMMAGGPASMDGAMADFAELSGANALTANAGPVHAGSFDDALGDFAGAAGVNDLTNMAGPSPISGGGDFEGSLGDFAGNAGVSDLIQSSQGSTGSGGGFSTGPGFNGGSGFSGGGSGEGMVPGNLATASLPEIDLDLSHIVHTRGMPRIDKAALDERGVFFIFGYLTNGAGDLRSLLLAEIDERDHGKFVGRLSVLGVNEEKLEELKTTLDGHRSPRAALPTPYRARWTKPVVKCTVAFEGWSSDGYLRNGHLLSFEEDAEALKKTSSRSRTVR